MKTIRSAAFFSLANICTVVVHAATVATVPVRNAGNAADTRFGANVGAVGYNYRIATTEVTNAHYVVFLNGVDPTGANTLALYSTNMSSDARGGINFNGSAAIGSQYEIKPGRDNNPVVFVSWFDSIRFANWMHNGMASGDTENGAYTLLGSTPQPANAFSITRNSGTRWWLPSEDEWYKAAYHKNDGATGNYWDYPTSTNAVPYSDQPPGAGAPNPTNTGNFFAIDDSDDNGYDDGWAVTGSMSFDVDSSQNYLTDAGAYTSSLSAYGTFDQGGNVSEWNETLPFGGLNRGVRGGSWFDIYSAPHAANRFDADFPGNEYFDLGFRVASIPEPASITLCIAIMMMLLLQPRGKCV